MACLITTTTASAWCNATATGISSRYQSPRESRDSYKEFKKAGAQVVGISADDAESHKAFAKKYRLPFTLLTDEGNKVRKEWGVPSDLFGALPGRQTYVLDKKGVVQLIYCWKIVNFSQLWTSIKVYSVDTYRLYLVGCVTYGQGYPTSQEVSKLE